MKHFIKKHRHHFSLWLVSAIILVASTFWLKSVDKQLAGQMTDQSSIAAAPASLSPAPPAAGPAPSSSPAALANQSPTKEKTSGAETKSSSSQPAENFSPPVSSAPIGEFLPEKKINASFKIIAPAWTKEFSIAVSPGASVFEAMKQLQSEQGLSWQSKDFAGLGAFVESINGLANNPRNNLFWIYYVNDKPAPLGVSSMKLNPNDVITWKYENAKF